MPIRTIVNRNLLLLFLSGFVLFANAQMVTQFKSPVKWTYSLNKIENGEAEILFKAQVDKGWHIYTLDTRIADYPQLAFYFLPDTIFKKNEKTGKIDTTFSDKYTVGDMIEGKPIKRFEKVFDMELSFFEEHAEFTQKIDINTDEAFKIKGYLEYITCNDSTCIPPEIVEYSVDIPAGNKKKSTEHDGTLLGIFIGGFLGGLLALLTPCVFPMIPMTVSFFTKRSETKRKGIINASIYSISIVVIYVLLGVLITVITGDPQTLNQMSSDVWFNLAFFIIFVVFGFSFLGAFEIVLPSAFVNKMDQASDRGGLIGIFFMAFTLSLVSFSCTGPIIGTLLVEAAVSGSVLGPAIGMTGFALALALPFGLFAMFPGWLNSLPKSGGWLNSVKVVLGFLELALALKFLSTVDLAYHWGILTREIFIALWIVLFALTGFYLLGKLKFSHDSDVKHISIPRLLFATVFLSFTVYLIPGLWGAPLKLVSGILPPSYYSENIVLLKSGAGASGEIKVIEGVDRSKCPHDLDCFHDYELALKHAKETNKPLMIDFTGYACVNCRKMEDNVWSDPSVLQRIKNDYVLVSLYVDDKQELPKELQTISETTGKKVKTFGNKWSDLQISRYGKNAQPWYVLLDHNEKELTTSRGYTPDIDAYVKFLEDGKKNLKKTRSNLQEN